MFDTTNSALRRFVMTTIAAGALASVTAGLALATAGKAWADEYDMEYTISLKDAHAKKAPRMYCPPPWYYLENKTYSAAAGWIVPPGVEVIEDGGIDVTLEPREAKLTNDASWQTWASGAKGTLTNTNPDPRDVKIILHCSSNPKDGYHPGS